MQLGDLIINYMLRVRGISKRMQGITIERIILIFAIASINHGRYPGVNSRYLTEDSVLVNCDLLQLSGILSSKETRQHTLGIPSASPPTTISNRVSNTPTNPTPDGRSALQPPQPPTQSSAVAYPPARGLPWNCISEIMWEYKSCPGCHFNHPEDSPRIKFHQEVGCLALA